MATTTPFTVRLEDSDHETLATLARVRGKVPAELARDLILDGISQQLDPAEIERELDEAKERLLAVAAEIRQRKRTKI